MRILVLQESDWLKLGPHDQHHLLEKLSLRGHEIRVIDYEVQWRMQSNGEIFSRRKVFNNVSKIYIGSAVTVIRPSILKIRVPGVDYISLIFSDYLEIRRQIKEFAPDAVIGLDLLNNYIGIEMAKKSNIPFVYYWIDLLHTFIPFKYFRPLGKAIEKRVLRQADIVLATNKALRSRQIEFGANPERAYVLRHGVDYERFNPDHVSGSIVRERYGISPDDIVIVFVGRLSPITGVTEVALELPKFPVPRLRFLVVGTGPQEGELRRIQEQYDLKQRLILTGWRQWDEIPGFIAASDICLLPFYNTEKTRYIVPLKIFDYMAMGKPVISTSLPGMVEEFGDDSGIIYVEKPRDVVGKAMELIANGINLRELGAKGRSSVAGHSWDDATDQLERTLNEAIAEKKVMK